MDALDEVDLVVVLCHGWKEGILTTTTNIFWEDSRAWNGGAEYQLSCNKSKYQSTMYLHYMGEFTKDSI